MAGPNAVVHRKGAVQDSWKLGNTADFLSYPTQCGHCGSKTHSAKGLMGGLWQSQNMAPVPPTFSPFHCAQSLLLLSTQMLNLVTTFHSFLTNSWHWSVRKREKTREFSIRRALNGPQEGISVMQVPWGKCRHLTQMSGPYGTYAPRNMPLSGLPIAITTWHECHHCSETKAHRMTARLSWAADDRGSRERAPEWSVLRWGNPLHL